MPGKSLSDTGFLIAQNSRENQPTGSLKFRRHLDQQLTKEIGGDNIELAREFPIVKIANLEPDGANFVQ